jgi:hypothetical protein
MITSVNGTLCYCLDGDIISEIRYEEDPADPDKQKRVIASFYGFEHRPRHIGTLKVLFNRECKLHNFAKPLVDGEKTLGKGFHELDWFNIDIPRHKYLRNLDIFLVPRTYFGLALSGLVTMMTAHNGISQEDFDKMTQAIFEYSRQIELPFRDSS